MDRYDRIMKDILVKTACNVLRWSVVNPQALQGVLPIEEGVRRVVLADYPLGENRYRLCFVESKSKRVGDFGFVSESPVCEIYILNLNSEVALILFDGLVERDDLLRLSGLLIEHNDQAKEFFEAFDRSGAA